MPGLLFGVSWTVEEKFAMVRPMVLPLYPSDGLPNSPIRAYTLLVIVPSGCISTAGSSCMAMRVRDQMKVIKRNQQIVNHSFIL